MSASISSGSRSGSLVLIAPRIGIRSDASGGASNGSPSSHLERHLKDADRVRVACAVLVEHCLRPIRIEPDQSLRERLADAPSTVARFVGVALDDGGISDAAPPVRIVNLPHDGLD